MRTQEEILARFEKADDFYGTQQGDLLCYMEFDFAKRFLKEDYVKKVEAGEEVWEVSTDPKKDILEYLDFAYEASENERGLSALRSMLHFKTWIWLDDADFYNEVIDLIDNHTEYGIPALDKISKHYGFVKA
jgi:hypothetical protein